MFDRASKSFQMAPQAITAAAVLLCSLAGGEGGTGRSSAASPPFSAEPQHREEALCAENDGVLTSRTNPGLTQAALRDSKQPEKCISPRWGHSTRALWAPLAGSPSAPPERSQSSRAVLLSPCPAPCLPPQQCWTSHQDRAVPHTQGLPGLCPEGCGTRSRGAHSTLTALGGTARKSGLCGARWQ